MTPEILQRSTNHEGILPHEITTGYLIGKERHPYTNKLTPCLTIHVPNSHSINMLTHDSSPTHYTPKGVEIIGLDGLNSNTTIRVSSASIGCDIGSGEKPQKRISRGIPSENKLALTLNGCFSVRLADANPPLNPQKEEGSEKIVSFLAESTKLAITVRKTEWIDRANNHQEIKKVNCKGSIVKIFGEEIDRVIDPWDFRYVYPISTRHLSAMEKTCNTWNQWNELQIKKAKAKAAKLQNKRKFNK